MKKKKEQKGITLVALVVTIILLLILAGISISQLTGSGLFEKAQEAKEKSKNAQELENSILSSYEIREYNKLNIWLELARNRKKRCYNRRFK